MLLRLAWKNIWRSRSRSLVVMGSVTVGVWALLFATGFENGFIVGYMANVINHDISHIQVHHPQFKNDFDIKYYIPNGHDKTAAVSKWPEVQAATDRTLVTGMISSTRKAAGIQIRGVIPEREAAVTRLDSLVAEGGYFTGIKRNPLLLGAKLAENLGVKVRSKVVLTFNDAHGNITAAAFRVAGIVKSSSVALNERYVFVRQQDLQPLLGLGEQVHEIAILARPRANLQELEQRYQAAYPEDLIETWKEIAPDLAVMNDLYGNMLYLLMGVILTALIFGIVNTMLMAVLERLRELGMLMAVGMSKKKIFGMIMIETVMLGLAGAPLGLLLGWTTISYYADKGLDLTKYSEGLSSFGLSSILYPYVAPQAYLIITIGVFITALLAAIYPARKAIRLNPVEALHKI